MERIKRKWLGHEISEGADTMTTFTNDTIMAIILADLDRTCCLCEKTYDARKMDEKFRHHEYCPECMAAEFGHDWADPRATDLNK